jgi:hypothetical protein
MNTQACELVPVIGHCLAKFYLLSDQSFFMRGHVTDRFRLVKSPISKNCLFNTFFINEINKKAM